MTSRSVFGKHVGKPPARRGTRGRRSESADSPAGNVSTDSPTRLHGTLLRINRAKGYGFIRPDGGGAEYFVHVNEMLRREDWNEGTAVTFKPGHTDGDSRKAPPALSVAAVGQRTADS